MPGWPAGLVRLGVLACGLLALSGCTSPPEFVVGITTDPQGRLALIVEACNDDESTATIWLSDGNGPPYPHASPTRDAGRRMSASVGLAESDLAVFTGPIGVGDPVVVPLVEPAAAGWTAEPPVTGLAPHRRYTVSRDRMSALAFDTGWFTQEPLNRPGVITAGTTNLDGKPDRLLDRSRWPQYVDQVCS